MVDGGDKLYASSMTTGEQLFQVPLFSSSGLSEGEHTLVMTNECWLNAGEVTNGYANDYFGIDFLVVEGTPLKPSTPSSTTSTSTSHLTTTKTTPTFISTDTSLIPATTSKQIISSASIILQSDTINPLPSTISSSEISTNAPTLVSGTINVISSSGTFTIPAPNTSVPDGTQGGVTTVLSGSLSVHRQCPIILYIFVWFWVMRIINFGR
ncbi:hypothetical protein TREMEDRAFT_63724 [Tremella mesenterica DSM 1558]|uniref:uncharacterized protein n=1 Tax=Tremella mesenterica (strain ATCC 24925 / CBS 8224 / DSM 1558 / NBRC 9311 / NRRL Y-6157 / RJB 2259-6 / UBC 559-6) TaxID=578456 RepID=UPI0003F4A623|nr:uncharacterized protein TREMEDRAFT_63724 [Tremella mesenterica DSM 1558]EIW67832.1 hypothetical protein TREMEDRAFT_63724 [Tremella mesenterica DSM 1558]